MSLTSLGSELLNVFTMKWEIFLEGFKSPEFRDLSVSPSLIWSLGSGSDSKWENYTVQSFAVALLSLRAGLETFLSVLLVPMGSSLGNVGFRFLRVCESVLLGWMMRVEIRMGVWVPTFSPNPKVPSLHPAVHSWWVKATLLSALNKGQFCVVTVVWLCLLDEHRLSNF